MRPAWLVLVLVCLLFSISLGRPAHAHVRSASWSAWTVDGADVHVRVRVSLLDLSAIAEKSPLSPHAEPDAARGIDEPSLARYLQDHLVVQADGRPCEVAASSYRELAGEEGIVARGWTLHCEAKEHLRISTSLFLDPVPSHLHFATLIRDDTPVAQQLLTRDAPAWDVTPKGESPSAGLFDFVALGMRHVATGADHIVFVLALLVAAKSLRALVGVVTGFTVGHSVTLGLAVFGAVHPDVATVEALVGASIAVVAVENVWLERRDPWLLRSLLAALAVLAAASGCVTHRPPVALLGLILFVACYFGLLSRSLTPLRLRGAVAALFGTVHGLAFSGALLEMKLARPQLTTALFGFNMGVEVAQLAIVCLAWPLFQWLAKPSIRSRTIVLLSAGALSAGSFWLIERTFG